MRLFWRALLLGCCFISSWIAGNAQTLVPKNIGAVTPLAWGDYDNDGDMDLLQHNGTALRILKNNLVGTTATFVDAGITLANVNPSSVGWIDFNNDGFLDIYYVDAGNLRVWINKLGTSFTQITVSLAGESISVIADWGDIDNDGDLDFVGGGVIMMNLGNNRFEVTQRLGSTSRTELLDYDNDGDLDFYSRDFLYLNKGQGIFELDKSLSPFGTSSTYLYGDLLFFRGGDNNSKSFASAYTGKFGFQDVLIFNFEVCGGGQDPFPLDYLKIADFDNDGKNDVLVRENASINLYTSTTSNCDIIAALAVPPGRTEVADFDRDGDLDVFIGNIVFENKTVTTNAAPSTPANLAHTIAGSSVTLSWSGATDDKTPANSLTYNLIIKRGPYVVVTDGIGGMGNQVLTQRGNAGYATTAKIQNLPKGEYTWSVQAVDEAYKVSTLALEKSFTVETGPVLVSPLTIPVQYSASYNSVGDKYLLTYITNGDLMGLWVDGKTMQPTGAEFKINSALSGASRHIVGFNPVKNEFMVGWQSGKKIYAKNIFSAGANLHAEKLVHSITDTLDVFLGGDKIAVDAAGGKYMIPFLQERTDLSRPESMPDYQGGEIIYYPHGVIDVYGLKVSSAGTTITNEAPKLLQTKGIPDNFTKPQTLGFTIHSAVDFDSVRRKYCLAWNFEGRRQAGYGGGTSGEITSILADDKIKLIVTDENLVFKSEYLLGTGTPRDLSLLYNPISDQHILVWSSWSEYTNGVGSDDYLFEVYQRIFSLQDNGTVNFLNQASRVSNLSNITNYGSGLPSLAWSKKRNEYLVTWTKGIASGSNGVLADGDLFYRRIHPKGYFVDSDSRYALSIPGNETIVRNNTKGGHFLFGWESSAQNLLSTFTIPRDSIPSVKEVTPNIAGAGTKVIIRATRIGNAPTINEVWFGGIKAQVDPVFPFPNDSTRIQVTVPTGLTREKVVVKVIFDDQSSTDNVLFENIDNTSVTLVTPLVGVLGETITISGINFPANPADFQVMFGNVPATLTDIVGTPSTTEIKVKVPQAAVRGSGQMVGVVIQGVLNIYAGGTFRVIRPPVIESVVAEEDFVSRKIIYINGADFSENPSDLIVKLGATEVTGKDFSSSNKTKITVRIPGGVKGNLPVSVYADDRLAESPVSYDFFLGSTIKIPPTTRPTEFRFTNQSNDKVDFTVEVLNRRAVKELNFRTKGISGSESDWKLQKLSLTNNSNRVDFALSEADFTTDPVGLDAEYVSIDSSGINPDTVRFKVYRNYIDPDPTNLIPDLRFGGSVADYQIVSIPYELQPNNITTVFKDLFNAYGYDKSKWRIFHYETNQSEYSEYLDGLNEIEPGKGYWLISRYPQDIFFEGARTLEVVNGYYEIPLQTGWNQIGNPYNFNLSWSEVMSYNGNPTAIESFKTFTDGTFQTATTIDRFRGGFVYYNGPGLDLKIPVTQNKGINGGRLEESKPFDSNLGAKEWRLGLELKAGGIRNTIGSFGMHPQSVAGTDERDEHRLPSFIHTLDFSFPESLATSIVGTQESYSWEFEVFNTLESTEVTLKWDNTSFGDNDRELYLHDRVEERLINMREKSSYTFTFRPGYTFNLHFGDKYYVERKAQPEQVVLSDAYPNPMSKITTIPFTVTKNKTHVQLSIFNLQGQAIRTLVNEELSSGFYEYEWDGRSTTGEELSGGVVMYRLQTSSPGAGVQSVNKKLVIAP